MLKQNNCIRLILLLVITPVYFFCEQGIATFSGTINKQISKQFPWCKKCFSCLCNSNKWEGAGDIGWISRNNSKSIISYHQFNMGKCERCYKMKLHNRWGIWLLMLHFLFLIGAINNQRRRESCDGPSKVSSYFQIYMSRKWKK